jgi:hypothetical protein
MDIGDDLQPEFLFQAPAGALHPEPFEGLIDGVAIEVDLTRDDVEMVGASVQVPPDAGQRF